MDEDSFKSILSTLVKAEVDCILIGGLAGMAMGSARATVDVDVVYSRSDKNIAKLASCLERHRPYLRGAPPGLPFRFDETTIKNGLNFTLTTELGDLDLLGEVPGDGTYEKLRPYTEMITIFEIEIQCVSLEKLIHLKRAAGRPKDLEAIAELEILLEEQNKE